MSNTKYRHEGINETELIKKAITTYLKTDHLFVSKNIDDEIGYIYKEFYKQKILICNLTLGMIAAQILLIME